jgi:hypothetical protein
MLHNQSVIYDADRENLKELIGFHSVNTTRIVNTIKDALSDKLGYKVMLTVLYFRKSKRQYLKNLK